MRRGLGSLSKSYKKLRWLVIVLAIAGLGWAWNWYNRQPVVGVVTNTLQSMGEVKSESTAAPSRYRSENISFVYPAVYTDNLNTAPNGPIIEQYSMAAHSEKNENRRISLMVKRASHALSMAEDSAYQFRVNSAEDYVLASESLSGGGKAEKFTKQDGSEVTYFINGDENYVIISATSNVASGGFVTDVKTVVDSLVWN